LAEINEPGAPNLGSMLEKLPHQVK